MLASRLRVPAAVVSALICAALAPAGAAAADSVFWANAESDALSVAALDGSGGHDLSTAGATLDFPFGVALDPAAGRIYWSSFPGGFISFANLDGSGGGGDLPIDGEAATANVITGVAIDPVAGRIYWTNMVGKEFLAPGPISVANLDGSGARDLEIEGATVDHPEGIVVDHAAGRIYWANRNGKISSADLDGGGASDLNTAGATAGVASALAVDPAAGLVYWTNQSANEISFARLDGSGGGDLPIAGAPVQSPKGIAIDHAAGRVYWANLLSPGEPDFGTLASARLDGSGGTLVSPGAATLTHPASPVLLVAPRPVAPPAIAGRAHTGSSLACSQGAWAADVPASLLYAAPRSFSYRWSRDGRDVAGATQSSFVPRSAGEYRCHVTALNGAGPATQASALVRVPATSFGRGAGLSLELLSRRIGAGDPVRVRVVNRNAFRVRGTLRAKAIGAAGRAAGPPAHRLAVAASGKRTLALRLPGALRRQLLADHRLRLRLTAAVRDLDGHRRNVTKTVAPRLRG